MKQLVYGNQQGPETSEKLQRVEMAAGTVRGTPGVFFDFEFLFSIFPHYYGT